MIFKAIDDGVKYIKRFLCLHRINTPFSRTKRGRDNLEPRAPVFLVSIRECWKSRQLNGSLRKGKWIQAKWRSHEGSHDASKFKDGARVSCSHSSEAQPVTELSHFLASFSSWAISWAAAEFSLHTPFTTVVWHLCNKSPDGQSALWVCLLRAKACLFLLLNLPTETDRGSFF